MLNRTLIKKLIIEKTNFKNCKTNNKQENLTKIEKFKFKKKILKATNRRRNIS
jgi:hypothetical protein